MCGWVSALPPSRLARDFLLIHDSRVVLTSARGPWHQGGGIPLRSVNTHVSSLFGGQLSSCRKGRKNKTMTNTKCVNSPLANSYHHLDDQAVIQTYPGHRIHLVIQGLVQVPLYRRRGSGRGLLQLLHLFGHDLHPLRDPTTLQASSRVSKHECTISGTRQYISEGCTKMT